MTIPPSWDPYFSTWMDRAELITWAPMHDRHHRRQLTLTTLIFNAGVAAVVELHHTSPGEAVSTWQANEPVAQGLDGSGGELLGGLWVLLVSVVALRTRSLSKALNWLGMAIGTAGVLSVVPALIDLAYGFGLLEIIWFVWLGVVMMRTSPQGSEVLTRHPDAEFARIHDALDDVVLEPTTMPWGNRSVLFRDPDGNLVNLFSRPAG